MLKHRLNSKSERAAILVALTRQLVATRCTDRVVLTEVDRLCRRTWRDIHPGWIRWACYCEQVLGDDAYAAWVSDNCKPVARRPRRS